MRDSLIASRSAVNDRPSNSPATSKSSNGTTTPNNENPKPNVFPENYKLFGSKLEAKTFFRSPDFLDSYQFPYNPDPLCRSNNYSIYEEMSDDDQVKAAIAVKKDMVVNTGWQIETENQEVRDFITEALSRVNKDLNGGSGGFDDVLRDMLSAYQFGFSLAEPVFKVDPVLKLWTISQIRVRPPQTFRFNIDDKGNVIDIEQTGNNKTEKFDPSVFIHHVYQMEFGNPYGRSDLRAAHASWKAKKFIMRFYNVYLERYASPTLVGRYKPTFTKGDIDELLEILENMQQNTAMVVPEDAMIEFVQAARDSSNSYGDALDKYDTKIARAILVPDLLGFSGSKTSGGSYALGKEQYKGFLGIIKKDRESLQAQITSRIVRPLIAVNWGPDEAARASFKFIPFSDESIIEGAKVWAEAVRSVGWEASDEEINHLRGVTGFPQGEVERKEPPPMLPGGGAGPLDKNGKPKKPEDKEKERKFSLQIYARRKQTNYEKKMDFPAILDVLDTSERRVTPPLARAARQISSDLIEQVKEKGLLKKFNPDAINDIQPRHMKDMNMIFRNHFSDLFAASTEEARREIYQDVKKFASEEDSHLPDEFLEILRAESFKIVGDYSTDITKRSKNLIMQGIKDGLGEGSIVGLIRDDLSNYTDRWLGTVVRTKTTEVYNDARKSFWDHDPIAAQVITAYQFSAILDDRTTDVCRDLDGKIFEKGDFLNRITPPLHMNCRSLLVPVTRFEAYKDDPGFVKPGKEPTTDSLKEMGGGLIV